MIVNDDDPFLFLRLLPPFFFFYRAPTWSDSCLCIYAHRDERILHAECVKRWPPPPPSSSSLSSSSIAWCASVHACLVPSQTCSATRGLYLHKRHVKSMCPCMFCSESNCLLKLRYVSSNLRCHYHQSVCVTTRELTYSSGTRQTAWFYGTCFKHSLRRLIDLSSCCLCLSFVLSVCLSVWPSDCLSWVDWRTFKLNGSHTYVRETICFECCMVAYR